ncbi:MAG: DUF2852 domain-containing protein [Myxococcota bacterium]
MTQMVTKLDDMGKPVWVALLVLSFVVFWPIGLALLAFLLTSGRLGHGRHACAAGWSRHRRWDPPSWHTRSGNSAFDEYRDQTLQRLEEEQQEFHDFLKQLRMAKDRTEFDRFMASRSARAAGDGSESENDDSTDEEPRNADPSSSPDA